MKLRDYQQEAFNKIVNSSNNKFVLHNPTRSGKGNIIIELMKHYKDNGYSVVYLSALSIMIEDIYDRYKNAYKEDINMLFGSKNKISNSNVYVSTYQTFVNRVNNLNLLSKKVFIFDESKGYDGKMYNKIISIAKPDIEIHSSATPYNSKGEKLYKDAEYIKTITIKECEEKGFRVPIKTYVPKFASILDFSDVEVNAGDYNQKKLGEVLSNNFFMSSFKKWINKLDLENRTTLIITANIKHTEAVYKAIERTDIEFDRVHSKLPSSHNDEVLEKFSNGSIKLVVSATKLIVGYDNKLIDTVIFIRPTLIRSLWLQSFRMNSPYKDTGYAEFYDLGNGTYNHGLYSREDQFKPAENKQEAKIKLRKLSIPEVIDLIKKNGEINQNLIYQYRNSLDNRDIGTLNDNELLKVMEFTKDIKRLYNAFVALYTRIDKGFLKESLISWVYQNVYYGFNVASNKDTYIKAIRNRMLKIIFTPDQFDIYNVFRTNGDISKFKYELKSLNTNKLKKLMKRKYPNVTKDKAKTILLYEIKKLIIKKEYSKAYNYASLYMSISNENKKPKFASLYYYVDFIFDDGYKYFKIERIR